MKAQLCESSLPVVIVSRQPVNFFILFFKKKKKKKFTKKNYESSIM